MALPSSIFLMSCWGVASGQCWRRMDRQKGLISHWQVMRNPASENPRSNPPMPEKNEARVGAVESRPMSCAHAEPFPDTLGVMSGKGSETSHSPRRFLNGAFRRPISLSASTRPFSNHDRRSRFGCERVHRLTLPDPREGHLDEAYVQNARLGGKILHISGTAADEESHPKCVALSPSNTSSAGSGRPDASTSPQLGNWCGLASEKWTQLTAWT